MPAWRSSASTESGSPSLSALKRLSDLSAAVLVNCWFVCFLFLQIHRLCEELSFCLQNDTNLKIGSLLKY